MRSQHPTKSDIIAELQRIGARDGCVSQSTFKKETGWDRHWFDRHWPIGGYQNACEEAGVKRGAIFGVESHLRLTDEELGIKFAEAVRSLGGKIPSSKRFSVITRTGLQTFLRGDTWQNAKLRVINAYFGLPANVRIGDTVDAALRDELSKLTGVNHERATITPTDVIIKHLIQVPSAFVSLVQGFRDRGEEEKRQLVAQFFHEVHGYRRGRVRSEHKHIDVQVNNRQDHPWLVAEVKQSLESGREKRAALRQGFDYAHRHGMRLVVITDGDYYEIYDRCAGQGLRYKEMLQGSFQLSALRTRDSDLR